MSDALIRQYYASFNERRIADAAALFSRDATVDHPPFTGALRGGDAYEQFADTWLRAFPDARLSVEHVRQRGDTTCEVDLVAIGTHRDVLNLGAYGTLKPNGVKAVLRMRELLEVQSGKITYSSLSFDLNDLFYQLARVDYSRLVEHLDQIHQLRDDLLRTDDDADRRRRLTEEVGRELDAARLVIRPWYRR
jgi:predicted ester cyclase